MFLGFLHQKRMPNWYSKHFFPIFLNLILYDIRAFNVGDDRTPLSFHYVPDKENRALLSHDHFACVINKNGSVAIAVEGNSEISLL